MSGQSTKGRKGISFHERAHKTITITECALYSHFNLTNCKESVTILIS